MSATNATGAPKSPVYPSPEYQKHIDDLQKSFAQLSAQINLLEFATAYAFSLDTGCNIDAVTCAIGNVSSQFKALQTQLNHLADLRGAM